ncbi:hypothetical protein Tco_1065190 [Tanacetum coccineum]
MVIVEEETVDVKDTTKSPHVPNEVPDDSDDIHYEMGVAYVDFKHKVNKGFRQTVKINDKIYDTVESVTSVTENLHGQTTSDDIPDIKTNLHYIIKYTKKEFTSINASMKFLPTST